MVGVASPPRGGVDLKNSTRGQLLYFGERVKKRGLVGQNLFYFFGV